MQAQKMKKAEVVQSDRSDELQHPLTDKEWGEYCKAYDGLNECLPYDQLMTRLTKAVSLPAEGLVVDAGSGTGNFATHLMLRCPGVTFIGIERQCQMREWAENKFSLFKNVNFLDGDLNGVDWINLVGEGRADAVFSSNVFYTLDNPRIFLDAAWCVLKPGGRLVISTPHTMTYDPILESHVRQGGGKIPGLEELKFFNDRIVTAAQVARYKVYQLGELIDLFADSGFVIDKAFDDAYAGVNTIVIGTKAI